MTGKVRKKHLMQRIPLVLLLALPVSLYLAVAALWQTQGLHQITGDEPHFLLIADSLVRDHDVFVRNNYFIEETPVHQARPLDDFSSPDWLQHTTGEFSGHGIGLPLVLSIPYYLAGVHGAKMFLALLAGVWPFLLYRAVYQIIESKPWSAVVALTLAAGLPFLAASNQIYPDLPAGMIILYVAERIIGILRGRHEQKISALSSFVVGILISFLPWLHSRFSAPATVLLLGYVYAVATLGSGQVRRPRRRWWLVPTAIFALSSVLLCYYNLIAFGNVFGGYGSSLLSFDIKEIGMIFLGLHWDQSQGMFMQQPLLLLGLVGVMPLIKANRRVALLLGTLYLSTLSLVSMCAACAYGQWSFAGRFEWAAVSLWVFPAAYAVKLLLEGSKAVVVLLCISSIFLQALFASRWLLQDQSLYNKDFGGPVWVSTSLYADLLNIALWLRLPFFKEFDNYLSYSANYVFVLFGLLLVTTGWLWQRGKTRLMGGMWSMFLVVGISIIVFVPPALNPLSVTARHLPGEIGAQDGESRVATEPERQGYLLFTPYTRFAALPAGSYEVDLEYESSGATGKSIAQWDIVDHAEKKVYASGDLPPSTANNGTFAHELVVSKPPPPGKMAMQFRVLYLGQGILRVERLTITPLSLDGFVDS